VLTDYQNSERFFEGNPSSSSIVMVGKSKRKLRQIKIDIWPLAFEEGDAEIDHKITIIRFSRIGFHITGSIEHKNVAEGFTPLEAYTVLISYIHNLFLLYQEETKENFYMSNYAGESWCKVDLIEMFKGLWRIDSIRQT